MSLYTGKALTLGPYNTPKSAHTFSQSWRLYYGLDRMELNVAALSYIRAQHLK
jgi:hypothetical protein